jgi:hypothetical protein
MSFGRAVPVLFSLAASLAPTHAQAQYDQPWVGRGILAQMSTGTWFTIRVENISTGEALRLSNGQSAPFVSAPVLWVIHTGSMNPIFTGGQRDKGEGLELLAETGDPSNLVQALAGKPDVVAIGAAARPIGASTDGPLTPGQYYEVQISAKPGQFLSAAWMFGQSNDLFYSNNQPVPLFSSSGTPRSAEMTTGLSLWDAGTEVNEEPGLGPNQGPRQATPDAGAIESQGIAHVRDRYTYPRTGAVLRVTVTPGRRAVSTR